jgi:hypothetical protein
MASVQWTKMEVSMDGETWAPVTGIEPYRALELWRHVRVLRSDGEWVSVKSHIDPNARMPLRSIPERQKPRVVKQDRLLDTKDI